MDVLSSEVTVAAYKFREVQIGKYRVNAHASRLPDGRWVGTANIRWEEPDATLEQPRHYEQSFDTEDEAIHHALEQVEIRLKNGDL
jgi:hypothetical protein